MNELIDVPLEYIKPNPYQPTSREDEIEELAASINDIGQTTPATLIYTGTPEAPEYIIVSGHKRFEALTYLKWPAMRSEIWHNDLSDKQQTIHMLKAFAASNTARRDFSLAEKAEVYQTMLDLGVSEQEIETATGDHSVPMLTKVGKGLDIASERLVVDELTLEELEVLTEFADDKDATDLLVAAIQEDDWYRVAIRLRQQKTYRQNLAAATQVLEDEACPVIKQDGNYACMVRLDVLGIAPEQHRTCDGHAAYIEQKWDGSVVTHYVCIDAKKKHSYKKPAKPEKTAHEQAEDEKAKAGREFKKEGLIDYEMRHDFAMITITGAKDPAKDIKGLFPFLAYCMSCRVGTINKATYEMLGKKVPMIDSPYDKDKDGNPKQVFNGGYRDFRPKNAPGAIKAMLAMTCSHINEDLRLAQEPKNYRTTHAVAFLDFLKANGYKLGSHDQLFIDAYTTDAT